MQKSLTGILIGSCLCWSCSLSLLLPPITETQEVRRGHMHNALTNIPRTKNSQYENQICCMAKIVMGSWGLHGTESVSPLKSNAAHFTTSKQCLCGC